MPPILRFACFLLLLSSLMLKAEEKNEERPNIIFFLVDDLRWNALGFMGDPVVKTPHLDALAKHGTVFEEAFTTTSICAVSRASILTGQWLRRHRINDFETGLNGERWNQTYPAQLKKSGYQTALIGKLGVGNAAEVKAKASEFDYWSGMAGQGGKSFFDPNDPLKRHSTARMGDEMLEFLKQRHPDRPFMMSVNFNAVHARDGEPREFWPDPRDESLYEDVTVPLPPTANEEAFESLPGFVKTSEGRRRWKWRYDEPEKAQRVIKDYYRLITGIDREVGRVYEALKEQKIENRTILVFASDNGFALGDRGLADKWFFYDPMIRVPLLIVDPRSPSDTQGSRVKEIVLNVDLAPTFLDLAQIKIPEAMQGQSLVPFLEGKTPSNWRDAFFYEHLTFPKIIPPVEGIRTKEWKYIRWIGTDPVVEELYHLVNDPNETKNLVHEPEAQTMLNALREKWKTLPATLE